MSFAAQHEPPPPGPQNINKLAFSYLVIQNALTKQSSHDPNQKEQPWACKEMNHLIFVRMFTSRYEHDKLPFGDINLTKVTSGRENATREMNLLHHISE